MKMLKKLALLCAAALSCCSLTVPADALTTVVQAESDEVEIFRISGEVPANFVIPSEYEGKKVAAVRERGFIDSQTLVTLTIPDTLAFLYESCFQNCQNLKTISFGSRVFQILDKAFKDCISLESLYFPDSLRNIGDYTFENCTSLKTVHFNDDITTIERYAFTGCTALTDVTIPVGCVAIYTGAFSDCTSLKTVTFLDRNTMIDNSSVTICNQSAPDGDQSTYNGIIRGYVGSTAEKFANSNHYRFEPLDPENVVITTTAVTTTRPVTTTTTSVTTTVTTTTVTTTTSPFDAENKCVRDGICYQSFGDYVMVCGYTDAALPAELVIPERVAGLPVKVIGERAFADMKGVTSVSLPLSVSTVADQAFYHCPDLNTLILRNPGISMNGDWTLICNDDLGMYTGVLKAYYPSDAAGFAASHEIRFEALPEVRGDATLDGVVSIDDAQLTLKVYTAYVAGMESTMNDVQKRTADVDRDLMVSVEDAQLILKYYTQNTVAGKNVTWDELLNKE